MWTASAWIAATGLGLAACVIVLRLLFPLPDLAGRRPSTAIPVSDDTTLGRLLRAEAAKHPGQSGVLPLATGHQALASRMLLASRAEASIDVQYYIWRNDVSGRLLFRALLDAARRGVRVRLLLDDNGIAGLDPTIAALNAQDNFEVRLFNPSPIRNPKWAGYVIDFFRMNRRMHNKAFIVDGAAAIIGGRNVGDEYFDIDRANYFLDLDVLAAGPVVRSTAENFDRYWNSASAYPADMLLSGSAATLPSYLEPACDCEWLKDMPEPALSAAGRLASGEIGLEWTDVLLVSDPPAKGLGRAPRDQLMIRKLAAVLGPVREKLDVVSAYFIPGRKGSAYFRGIQAGGAQVTVLTNAFSTTDVAVVHAGYTKYRRHLLRAGITLYEMRPQAGAAEGGEHELPVRGSSASSLHAKTLAVDGNRIFIGSFNFDPRSVWLNCEMGFLIASPSMAEHLSRTIESGIPNGLYRVTLEGGRIRWIEHTGDGAVVVHANEPGMTRGARVAIAVLRWLPIEWLL